MLKKIEKVIDVHTHIFPDFYIKTMKEEFGLPDCGGAPWPKWSLEGLIKTMDKKGIEKAYMSYSMPGVYFKNDLWSRNFSRKCNEHMAEMISRFPKRLGGFASLPLPDVEGAVKEKGVIK
jgi:predicted TIM-barrel fold metal-dependent hydrolase